jgi:transposase InsO family protein
VLGVCRKVQMTAQNYYARRKQRRRRQIDGDLVCGLVARERRLQPRLGTRKLHHLLEGEFKRLGIRMGRDRLFEELRKREQLLRPIPAPYPRTTQSYHNLPVFRNLIEQTAATQPNEIWVSDLTYLRTMEGYLYLALITDAYSRKIVGWHAGDTLEAVGCVRALDLALTELPAHCKPIHHSDQGSQYCCHEYVNRLQERGLGISMTESNHCAENALAERMNGILKQEYGLGMEFATKAMARRTVLQGIGLYNTKRPHGALNLRVPDEVHRAKLN